MSHALWQRKIIEIRSPKDSEETPEAFEQALSAIAMTKHMPLWRKLLLGHHHPIISVELANFDQLIHFYVTTPTFFQTYVESQLLAQYPRLLLSEGDDPFIHFSKEKNIVVGRMALATSYYYPLKTYKDFKEVDPMSTTLGIMSKATPNQKLYVQIVLEPSGSHWQSSAHHVVSTGIKDSATGTMKAHPAAKSIATKIEKNGFKVGIRLATVAETYEDAYRLLLSLGGSFGTLASGEGNQLIFKRSWPWQKSRLIRTMEQRTIRVTPSYQFLNIAEIASIWHPPTMAVAGIRNIAWGKKYQGEPPQNLPIAEGLDAEGKREINFFARTEFKNRVVTFGIKRADRRRHVYAIGKTGTGKSTFIANMAINDMRNREGLAVIDPHGDLSNILLDYIPSFRINDVVYLDPSDVEHPFAINPLEVKKLEHKELIASGFVAIFYKLYAHSWGPRLEYILRNVIMTLLEVPNATMVDIPLLLTDDEWRHRRAIPKITDQTLLNFWTKEFDNMHPRLKSEAISPILNKVGQFVSSPMIRGIIGHPTSSIDLEEIMNKGKILILNLAQGKLGEDNAALLGAMFITKMQLAAMNRVYQREEDRRDFYLYVDEFQNFATTSFIKILSEARKYRLNLTLANQYVGQVLEDVQKAIFGNAGTLVSFIVGAQDAFLLAKEFGQIYKDTDLVQLNNYQILLKLGIDSITSMPFFATTLPLPRAKNQNREKILRVSREKFTRKVKIQTGVPFTEVKLPTENLSGPVVSSPANPTS